MKVCVDVTATSESKNPIITKISRWIGFYISVLPLLPRSVRFRVQFPSPVYNRSENLHRDNCASSSVVVVICILNLIRSSTSKISRLPHACRRRPLDNGHRVSYIIPKRIRAEQFKNMGFDKGRLYGRSKMRNEQSNTAILRQG